MSYRHLGLRDWPFRIVPEPEFCDFLADRVGLRKDVEELLYSLEARPTSDIHLIWSWYGAGKTHTLYYLANQCRERHPRLAPVYTELPREAKGFPDLYRSVVSQLPLESIIDGFLEFSTRPHRSVTFGRAFDLDLSAALTQAALGERSVQVLLAQWLLGNSVPAASLRQLGVGARISGTEKCATILSDVVALLAPRAAAPTDEPRRVIWIIDEVQRVESLPAAAHRSILSGLVGVFNKCSTGLTVLLSYTGTPKEDSLPDWIPDDLKDRIGLGRSLLLPPLRSDEAVLLVRELLEHFRLPQPDRLDPFHPFNLEAVELLITALARGEDLKPRRIMETLDACLRQLDSALKTGTIKTIGADALRDSLVGFRLDWSKGPVKARRSRQR